MTRRFLADGGCVTDRTLPPGTFGYECIRLGDRIETGRLTVTAALIDRFADLTGDRFAIHMDDAAARSMGFPARVAHGLLVLSLIDGLKNQAPAQFDAVASLGWDWRFSQPVPLGASIGAVLTVTAKRVTRRPDRGILSLDVVVTDGHGRAVQAGTNQLLVKRQGRFDQTTGLRFSADPSGAGRPEEQTDCEERRANLSS